MITNSQIVNIIGYIDRLHVSLSKRIFVDYGGILLSRYTKPLVVDNDSERDVNALRYYYETLRAAHIAEAENAPTDEINVLYNIARKLKKEFLDVALDGDNAE